MILNSIGATNFTTNISQEEASKFLAQASN